MKCLVLLLITLVLVKSFPLDNVKDTEQETEVNKLHSHFIPSAHHGKLCLLAVLTVYILADV